MRALGDYLGVKVHACVGGTIVREDQRILSAGVHVVVATPGRVFDMLKRQSLRPDYIKMFVLDEADEMLSRGFKDQTWLDRRRIDLSLMVQNMIPKYMKCLHHKMGRISSHHMMKYMKALMIFMLYGFEKPSAIQ